MSLVREQGARVERRNFRRHPGARRQRSACVARAVDRLREDGVRTIVPGLDDHVVRLRGGDPELVDRHRLDILAVRRDDGELQARDAHVEDAHRRAVDESQADALAALEQRGPVVCRGDAVHQIGVCVAGDVEQIGRIHPHLSPHAAVIERLLPALLARVAEEIADRALVEVVVVALLLERREDPLRIDVGPIGQQHHVLAVCMLPLAAARLDDDGTVQPGLFLEARVRVIPVSAVLVHLEAIDVTAAARDAVEADPRHAVHVRGHDHAVPVNRAAHSQPIGNAQRDRVALAPA